MNKNAYLQILVWALRGLDLEPQADLKLDPHFIQSHTECIAAAQASTLYANGVECVCVYRAKPSSMRVCVYRVRPASTRHSVCDYLLGSRPTPTPYTSRVMELLHGISDGDAGHVASTAAATALLCSGTRGA